jgi:two-component system chemotaxis response regulator CheB
LTVRVLIVDDSPTMRSILAARLSGQDGIRVVGLASHAAEARTMMKELEPDVVTLDIEMPGMNGLDFLDKIMTLRPTPVIIVSGLTHAGSDTTARALVLGAVDTYCKADFTGNAIDDGGVLAGLVRQAAQVTLHRRHPAEIARMAEPVRAHSAATRLITIGSSTGGVEALQVLLSAFPADCPPTMIVQHVDARFAPAIARTLNAASPAQVVLAEADMPLRRGTVYLAPGGDRHMLVAGTPRADGTGLHAKLRPGELISGHRPSVDALFASAATVVGAEAVGILLTGMGADGAKGLLALSRTGALTIAQDEASCTVFGMPRVAISLGAARVVAPITRIATHAFS